MSAVASNPISLEDFEKLSQSDGRHEVDRGILLTLPPAKSLHTLIALRVLEILQEYLRGKSSKALPEAGFLLCREPLTIRQPDISVLSHQRIATANPDSYFEGAPDVAVEIVSPSDTAYEIELKVRQYLQYGSAQVWVLYPTTRSLHLFTPDSTATILSTAEILRAATPLNGLEVPVISFFSN